MAGMDRRLLKAAISGNAAEIKQLALNDVGVLLGTTPQGNTCLHIASIHGNEGFCKDVLTLNQSLPLLKAINADGETPLLTAVARGHAFLAQVLLTFYREWQLSDEILKQDRRRCNALHHAIRSGHTKLALELIEAESALSQAVNEYGESPMFIAVMRNYGDVFEKLLEIPNSAHGGATGMNALHAAVRYNNSDIAKRIMETRPAMAKEKEFVNNNTPIQLAALWNQIDVLSVLLTNDPSLGYVPLSTAGEPILVKAAYRGLVDLARELLKHCPDAPYGFSSTVAEYSTCLHMAVLSQRTEFVEFILASPQLHGLINMQDSNGDTALHLAVQKCDPKMVATLLLRQDIDVTVLNKGGNGAIWQLANDTERAKTLNWNEVYMRLMKADPQDRQSIRNVYKFATDRAIDSSRKDIKSLTQMYTGNTSLVAVLIATITFAAAFTLPGGYSSDPGNEGLPIMARKFAFKAFLISDTLAMCCSLAVAFVCIIARWQDFEFLLYYRSFTKKLMWFAYMATTTAFATGLYTVLAPHLLWLAVVVCVLTSLLPILTKLLGEWFILRLRFRLGKAFNSELLDMV